MNQREKILGSITGGAAVLLLGFLLVSKLFIGPVNDLDIQIRDAESKKEDLKTENAREKSYLDQLREINSKAVAFEEPRVSELLRARLVDLLRPSNLSSDNLSLKPITGTRAAGYYKEIGWFVHVRGRLEQLVNFLYLLSNEPYLHKLDSIVVSPITRSAELELQLKYTTLVLDPRPGEKFPATQPIENAPIADLQQLNRSAYQTIVMRDLLRPYFPKNQNFVSSQPSNDTTNFGESTESRLVIVGLPSWGNGISDVIVKDIGNNQTQTLHVGDVLGSGLIVAVDYRRLPFTEKPGFSDSRAILEIGGNYFTIDLGDSLANRKPVLLSSLPKELKIKPSNTQIAPPPPSTPATQPDNPAATQPAEMQDNSKNNNTDSSNSASDSTAPQSPNEQ